MMGPIRYPAVTDRCGRPIAETLAPAAPPPAEMPPAEAVAMTEAEAVLIGAAGAASPAKAVEGAPVPVLSPHERDDSNTESTWVPDPDLPGGGRYLPNGKAELFYGVDATRRISATEVVVSCSVSWAPLAGRGYEYTLRKIGDTWRVVNEKPTWVS